MSKFSKPDTPERKSDMKSLKITVVGLILALVVMFAADPILGGINHMMLKNSNLYEYGMVNQRDCKDYYIMLSQKNKKSIDEIGVSLGVNELDDMRKSSIHVCSNFFRCIRPEYMQYLGYDGYMFVSKYELGRGKHGYFATRIESSLDRANDRVELHSQLVIPVELKTEEELKEQFVARFKYQDIKLAKISDIYKEAFGEELPVFLQNYSGVSDDDEKFGTNYYIMFKHGVLLLNVSEGLSVYGHKFVYEKDFPEKLEESDIRFVETMYEYKEKIRR